MSQARVFKFTSKPTVSCHRGWHRAVDIQNWVESEDARGSPQPRRHKAGGDANDAPLVHGQEGLPGPSRREHRCTWPHTQRPGGNPSPSGTSASLPGHFSCKHKGPGTLREGLRAHRARGWGLDPRRRGVSRAEAHLKVRHVSGRTGLSFVTHVKSLCGVRRAMGLGGTRRSSSTI